MGAGHCWSTGWPPVRPQVLLSHRLCPRPLPRCAGRAAPYGKSNRASSSNAGNLPWTRLCSKYHMFLFFFFFNFIYLFIYLWLCWVFVSARGLSLVAASGGPSSSRCAGLSPSRPLLWRSTGSRRAGAVAVAHGPSCSAACGIFPDQGSNPCPLHWQADSQPLRHQGSPQVLYIRYLQFFVCQSYIIHFKKKENGRKIKMHLQKTEIQNINN